MLRVILKKPGEDDDMVRVSVHSASTASPVNVAEAILAKQADLWPCGSVNTDTIYSKIF
jgi:hypothetical protein